MRILTAAALLLLALPALAGDPPLRAPVQIAVTGFKAVLQDGLVKLTWRRYKRDDFASLAVVKSEKDSDPGFPGAPAVVTSNKPDVVAHDDGKLAAGTWNYRLVITTKYGDRWVSPVVAVVIREEDLRRAPPGNSDFAD